MILIKRTDSNNSGFRELIAALDKDLWRMNYTNQGEYDKLNIIENLDTVVIAYDNDTPVGCGCFKKFDDASAEIKRMYVAPGQRGKGIAYLILKELEAWANESGYPRAILETGTAQTEALYLYNKAGYAVMENYGQYIGMPDSICMAKDLV